SACFAAAVGLTVADFAADVQQGWMCSVDLSAVCVFSAVIFSSVQQCFVVVLCFSAVCSCVFQQ
ncbi:hypothetical protein U1Q18_024321, partial [Sarracenia purpurea var. burkii]